jgi:excisionase family DNA binding protein
MPKSPERVPKPIRSIVVSPATAAEMLDVTRSHIYQLIERGVLGRCQLGGSRAVRIPVADIYAAAGLEMPADVGEAS